MPGRMVDLLRDGDEVRESRRVVFSIMLSAIQCGLSYQHMAYELINNRRNSGGAFFRSMGKAKAHDAFERLWTAAEQWIDRHPAGPDDGWVEDQVAQLRVLVGEHQHYWAGQRTLDRWALMVLLDIAAEVSMTDISVSVRVLADKLLCTHDTAANVLRRLCATPFLSVLQEGRGSKATRYRLPIAEQIKCDQPEAKHLDKTMTLDQPPGASETCVPVSRTRLGGSAAGLPNLFAQRRTKGDTAVLGRSAAVVYDLLADGRGCTAKELVLASGKHRKTVATALERLIGAELVEEIDGGVYCQTSISVAKAEAYRSVRDLRELRRQWAEAARADWLRYLATKWERQHKVDHANSVMTDHWRTAA